MNNLRVLIADDERPAREYLKSLLAEFPRVTVVGEAENGSEAVEMIVRLNPDLALLDLQMPELSGIEAVRELDESEMPLIAFVTAYDRFAIQAFELNAVDYLLKPIESSRLQATLDRASERLGKADRRGSETGRIADAITALDDPQNSKLERIPVRHRDDYYFVPVADVALLTADAELLNIITTAGDKFVLNFRLKDIETRLDDAQFVRLSRSAIANIDQIERISPTPGGTYSVVMKNGTEIAASRLQSRELRTRLLKL